MARSGIIRNEYVKRSLKVYIRDIGRKIRKNGLKWTEKF